MVYGPNGTFILYFVQLSNTKFTSIIILPPKLDRIYTLFKKQVINL